MSFILPVALILFLLVTMFVAARIGERTRIRDERDQPGESNDVAAMEAAILGLMGLLLAFTFTESTERTAERRALVVREIASIETVYNRAALLDEEPRQALTGYVRRYAERHAKLEREPDEAEQLRLIEENRQLEAQIWAVVTSVVRAHPEMAEVLVDSTNEMFAIVTERLAMQRRPAQVGVFALLGVLAWASAYIAGYAVGAQPGKHRPHLIAFIVVTVMTIYLIVDMQYTRVGLIQVTDTNELYDALLRELR